MSVRRVTIRRMTMTTRQVADQLGITPGGVRELVRRRRLEPERRGAHPLRFPDAEVWRLIRERQPDAERDEINAAWDVADQQLASQVSGV